MTSMTFADRYASAGLAPNPTLIASRQEPAKRIVENITNDQIFGLVGRYYGIHDFDFSWFRDEFQKDDPSFSLINNENETVLLSALVLSDLVENEEAVAILALISCSAAGLRTPVDCTWLLQLAKQKRINLSVEDRKPIKFTPKVSSTQTIKLKEEVAALAENDWATLIAILGKIRTESQQSMSNMSTQATNALVALKEENEYLREESQMLWWIFGGHSSSLKASFSTFTPHQTAFVGSIDLGILTTSNYGPIAASAMLERVLSLSKRPKGAQSTELSKVLDSFSKADLQRLEINHSKLPARIAPIATALELARTLGVGAWGNLFQEKTGLDATVTLDPLDLAEQLYCEHLLGQHL
ncbi:hypothetical protein NTD86_00200 [Pseudomonas sp. 7P_10.2_Bac1]|uniref:GTPase-associated system all-helical protein GASH n=1 Tax=Pseudomonas sp. 7P_10.2_Bac1 TaxID=2971614 RepID=UPI0021C693BA|nr:GTPase-associated system all-helical protein GASH [Pseudomonas sp. 7P_10.2_Bac1]MCU1725408.1 hypothetical protein [Pseudomonas sp. 7P_10.2_Bac1]